ncbi:MAG TPA: phosphotransferase enzyme family protein [Bacteroidetes bacterium]|nr:phosphotransferase enzyme family protein [Bacteroidota bacterium]
MKSKLTKLFKHRFQEDPVSITALKAHGSDRKLFRIKSDRRSVIGAANEDRSENIAFLEFSRHFRKEGLNVPEIYAEDLDNGIYLEEDLGDLTLFDALQKERKGSKEFPASIITAYEKVVTELPKFQIDAGKSLDYGLCYPRHSFDRQSMMWDLNYFKYYFLKLAKIPFNEQKLEDDFIKFTDFLLQPEPDYFLYRDFQSRNIMLRRDEPWFIDYQGGRHGALQYDIASLLFDAKADIPFAVRDRLLDTYLKELTQYIEFDGAQFLQFYYGYVLVRIMQAMGAYGFRGFYERKTHFLQSVPYAIRNLEFVLRTAKIPTELPTLFDVLRQLVRSTRLRELGNVKLLLTVRIQSFSYKKGLPRDETGHGGGFIFDCRSLPNPGRQERFKNLTGNDAAVIAFLAEKEEVHSFLTRVRDLLSQVIENYRQRNFSDLSVAFGCTGGQHRSVYCANTIAKYLREKYKINIEVTHRELQIIKVAG